MATQQQKKDTAHKENKMKPLLKSNTSTCLEFAQLA
jgi:hypothetical protein